jgi:carbon-monoxide dehydrogenase medium subunit
MLVEVAAGIAYRAVRNRGTIGGSLAHADPAGDWPLALAALGADVVLRGPAGERAVPAGRLITAAFTTEIRDDEIVTAVLVPKLSGAARFGYFKFCRKTGEFPEASAAVVIDPDRHTTRAYLGALSGPPQPLPELARRIGAGEVATAHRDVAAEAVASVAGLDAVDRRMHAGALLRALERALGR